MIKARRRSFKTIEPVRRVRDVRAFLRTAAAELRRIAEEAPELAIELRHVAQEVEAEAKDLEPTSGAAADPGNQAGRSGGEQGQ